MTYKDLNNQLQTIRVTIAETRDKNLDKRLDGWYFIYQYSKVKHKTRNKREALKKYNQL